jgi:hypothetical protein
LWQHLGELGEDREDDGALLRYARPILGGYGGRQATHFAGFFEIVICHGRAYAAICSGRTRYLGGLNLSSMNVTSSAPEVGQIVRVRQRLYLVEGLVPRPRPQDSTLVELSCIEDNAQGQELKVLWERELDAARSDGGGVGADCPGFDSAEYFSAYLNTLRWNCVTSTDASLLQSPFRAGIRLDAFNWSHRGKRCGCRA